VQPARAIDNQKLRLAQPALDKIVENGAPGFAGLAAHVFDRQQHLLTVLANPEHDQEHDRGGLAVDPDPHHGAIEDQADDRLVSERAFQASQSAFTFRHTRLSVSLPTAPPKTAASARRTQRLLVPAR